MSKIKNAITVCDDSDLHLLIKTFNQLQSLEIEKLNYFLLKKASHDYLLKSQNDSAIWFVSFDQASLDLYVLQSMFRYEPPKTTTSFLRPLIDFCKARGVELIFFHEAVYGTEPKQIELEKQILGTTYVFNRALPINYN